MQSPPTDRQTAHILERLRAALADRYAIEGEIGRGGMATVFGARDLRHSRQVAIKVLPPELATAIAAERFLREIRAAAQLLHPHILGLIDSGDAEGVLYYIMPHVHGESLRDKLNREQRLSPAATARIAREVAGALTHAHQHGFVHRDIKPENILLVDGMHAMVADFGLAHAIHESSDRRLTHSRHLVGTLYYMSPEQAAGDADIDGRSDIYSLGCMLFELLTGRPPFRGATDLAIIAKHLREPPPRLSGGRLNVPVAIERVVHRSLEKDPARRFQVASDLARELDAAVEGIPQPWFRRGAPIRMRPGRRAAVTVVVLAALAGVALSTPQAGQLRSRIAATWSTPLDDTRFLILPFGRVGNSTESVDAELTVQDAMERWQGVAATLSLPQAGSTTDSAGLSIGAAQRLAKRAGAGRFVVGEVGVVGDSVRLHTALHDGATAARLHDVTVKLARADVANELQYRRLADALLFQLIPADVPADPGTTSYAARRAVIRGEQAMKNWDLAEADSAFSNAIASDGEYATPYLRLAQVRSWAQESPQRWRSLAQVAINKGARLGERDRTLALALLAMADADYPKACTLYGQLRTADPRDFAAAYGAGECVRLDVVVVPDPRSPSRFRFRASRSRGLNAYRDAFELWPATYKQFQLPSFDRLRSILMTTTSTRLVGRGPPPDNMQFRAAPSWAGDSLALVPFPMRDEVVDRERTVNATTVQAVNHQRDMFRDIATSWRREFPQAVEPLVAVAVALELRGDPASLDTLRAARQLATDSTQRLRLAAQEVWLRVKFALPDRSAGLVAARDLADSLLVRPTVTLPAALEELAAIAILTGRADLGASLARRGQPASRDLSASVVATSRALLAYAAAGGPADSIRALERSLAEELRAAVVPAEYRQRLYQLLAQAAALAYPVLPFENTAALDDPRNDILHAQARLAAGDTAGARAVFDRMRAARATRRPADFTLDITYPAAWTLAALGRTGDAVEWLEPVLTAASGYPPQVISQLANAGALMRACLLRAELADIAGDAVTARRWRAPVAILWQNADSALRPFLSGRRTLSRPR